MSSILAFEFFFAVIIIVLQADVFLRPHLQAHCNKSNALVLPGKKLVLGFDDVGVRRYEDRGRRGGSRIPCFSQSRVLRR